MKISGDSVTVTYPGTRSWTQNFVGRRSFLFFERVLEASACPLIVVDAAQSVRPIVYASPAFQTASGYPMTELLGRPWATLADLEGAALPSSSAGHWSLNNGTRGTLRLWHRDQTLLYFDAQVSELCDDEGRLTHYIVVLYDKTAEQHAQEILQYRARHDPLTGLANRYVLRERFDYEAAHALRRNEAFSLAILDLNGFKAINDAFGHNIGDALLQEVGRRLQAAVREEDTVVRLGGDEFVLLLSDVQVAVSIVERVNESLKQPMALPGRQVAISCSSGIARFPDDGRNLEALLKVADARLYAGKRTLSGSSGGYFPLRVARSHL
jgi:diguanylate cyclase (GGDEF)-like protein